MKKIIQNTLSIFIVILLLFSNSVSAFADNCDHPLENQFYTLIFNENKHTLRHNWYCKKCGIYDYYNGVFLQDGLSKACREDGKYFFRSNGNCTVTFKREIPDWFTDSASDKVKIKVSIIDLQDLLNTTDEHKGSYYMGSYPTPIEYYNNIVSEANNNAREIILSKNNSDTVKLSQGLHLLLVSVTGLEEGKEDEQAQSVYIGVDGSTMGETEDFKFEYDSNNDVIIKEYIGSKTNVSVPNEINGHKVIKIDENAFYKKKGDTVTESIYIPDTVKEIGNYAFENCKKLKTIRLPEGIDTINEYTFYNCSNLEKIELPKTVKEIKNYAFYNCAQMEINEDFTDNLITIGDYAFSNCKNLSESVYVPKNLAIGKRSFEKCTSIKNVIVEDENANIFPTAFIFYEEYETVDKYVSLTVPITYYNKYPVVPHNVLKTIHFTKGSTGVGPDYAEDGADAYVNKLNESPYQTNYDEITFEEGITYIGNYMQFGNINNLVLPSTLKTVGDYAFTGDIDTLVIPEGVLSLGRDAFSGNHKTVILPSTLETAEFGAIGYTENEINCNVPNRYYKNTSPGVKALLNNSTYLNVNQIDWNIPISETNNMGSKNIVLSENFYDVAEPQQATGYYPWSTWGTAPVNNVNSILLFSRDYIIGGDPNKENAISTHTFRQWYELFPCENLYFYTECLKRNLVGIDSTVHPGIIQHLLTVRFNANGGEFEDKENDNVWTYLNNEIVDMTNIKVHRDGYRLVGWEIRENDFMGISEPPYKTVSLDEDIIVNNDFTLYAVWQEEATVTVRYVDKNNIKLADDIVINSYINEPYYTEKKEFDNYDLKEVIGDAQGTINAKTIQVTYVYELKPTSVVVHYVDENDKTLIDDVVINGRIFDEFETEEAVIYGYYVSEYPEVTKGKMTKDIIEVTYKYAHKTSVAIVKYLEKGTDKELSEDIVLSGAVGDDYLTEAKDIENYSLIEEPESKSGTFSEDTTTLVYYYERVPEAPTTDNTEVEKEENEEIIQKEQNKKQPLKHSKKHSKKRKIKSIISPKTGLDLQMLILIIVLIFVTLVLLIVIRKTGKKFFEVDNNYVIKTNETDNQKQNN